MEHPPQDNLNDIGKCILQINKTHVAWLGKLPWTLKHPVEGIAHQHSLPPFGPPKEEQWLPLSYRETLLLMSLVKEEMGEGLTRKGIDIFLFIYFYHYIPCRVAIRALEPMAYGLCLWITHQLIAVGRWVLWSRQAGLFSTSSGFDHRLVPDQPIGYSPCWGWLNLLSKN